MKVIEFDKEQFNYFKEVEDKRFFWQTTNSFIAEKEKEILSVLDINEKSLLLEVGCGEGANILNLNYAGYIVGLDYSFNRLLFAKSKINNKRIDQSFVCADALRLPFADGKFDFVFIKDVLHHSRNKKILILELIRVCKKNGMLSIIEMNGRTNLIGWLFASLTKKERGMKEIDIKEILSFLAENGVVNVRVIMKQPLLLYRLIFHYSHCLCRLSSFEPVKLLVNLIEEFGKRIISEKKWGYIIILAERS